MTSWAYFARTTHQRSAPKGRRFVYKLFYLFLDIDGIGEAAAATKLFAYNRPGLFSFYDRDHGDGSDASLRAWAEKALNEAGVDLNGGRIMLLALPRILGFVFNPLSVFFGYDQDDRLQGVLYEVRNTFGESHVYAAPAHQGASRQNAPKALHVSPFFAVRGSYSFALQAPDERLSLTVQNIVDGRVEHIATLTGARAALSDRSLLAAFLMLPLMTIGVVAAIHWQALKLWLRGARYHKKPAAPTASVSQARLLIEPSGPAAN
ncbi:MAG TPA: DUF1365 domain-containing protein [Caulobacterales bacterium]|jgi:DUF1365 family protein|nr:DUF1365 domain-containing protein [Caulobacterales bacterium]